MYSSIEIIIAHSLSLLLFFVLVAVILGSLLKFSLIQMVEYLELQLELTYWKDHV